MTARLPLNLVGGLFLALMALASCAGGADAPPRAEDPVVFEEEPSILGIDLAVDLAGLERELEGDIPRQLWAIEREGLVCVPPKKVKVVLFKVKTPTVKCDIEGKVTRGRLRISGRGETLRITVPIKALVVAKDIGGILKQETGTGEVDLQLDVRLALTPDWQMRGDVSVDYAWSKEPGIDFLGRRIEFTKDADKELRPLLSEVEEALEKALAGFDLKSGAERGWQAAHTVLEINEANPPVWARISPRSFHYGGYSVSGKELRITLGIESVLEAHIGTKPDRPEISALPPIEPLEIEPGFAVLKIPAVSDYAVLEPVILKALRKRARRPFELGESGRIVARFDEVSVYGTSGNRMAVGLTFTAASNFNLLPDTSGRVWLTARPVTAPNSREITLEDVEVAAETDMVGQNLLLMLANSNYLTEVIADALKQNLEKDFEKLTGKIERAVASRQDGPLAYSVTLDEITTGQIKAFGMGLHLPVEMRARMDAQLVKMD